MTIHSLRIQPAEFKQRTEKLWQFVLANDLRGVVLFDNINILYFSGFAFMPTERLIAFVMNADGEQAMVVPRLELEHAHAETHLDHITHYMEYPSNPHPTVVLKQLLSDMDIRGADNQLGADMNGYPWIFGYEGTSLEALTGMAFVNLQGHINRMQAIKSAAELTLIKESCKWTHLAHMLLQRYTAVNETETAVSLRASQEATLIMLDTIGPLYRSQDMWNNGPGAYYRGQIGRGSAIPHALANNITFQPGDVLVTGAVCPVWGYNSELERTMFIGEPDKRQKELFSHVKTAQEVAFEALKPGVHCHDVDSAVRAYYEQNNLMPYWKHHTGHAIGLRYHEGPFLDTGDDRVIAEGNVFTVEPGLYVPEVGGFRHSDTVVITADGIEIVTYYPRDWPSLVIPI